MIKHHRLQWIIAIIVVGTFFCLTAPVTSTLSAEHPTMGESYPDFSEGILESAKLEKMDKGLLLKANGFEIKDSFVEKVFGQVTPEIRKGAGEKSTFSSGSGSDGGTHHKGCQIHGYSNGPPK